MMNRLAVVLAADSATTVSRWAEGKREERYFKGANKVFQLSDMHPVGLMIFDSADILNVPWEVIIKSFRISLGHKAFNSVEEYAKELFNFLNDNPRFFPDDIQREEVVRAARGVLFTWLSQAVEDIEEADRVAAVQNLFDAERARLDEIPASACVGEELLNKSVGEYSGLLKETVDAVLEPFKIPAAGLDTTKLAEICLLEVMKQPSHYLNTTGLVFAGFGDHEIFPAMVEYQSCGIIGGKHIFESISNSKVDHHQPAWLGAFAQTSMTDTFSAGLSPDVYGSVMITIQENLRLFAKEIADKSGGDVAAIDDLESLVQAARRKIGEVVLDNARKEHSLPLRSVLGVLPANEMAELAETLITLQSLKEKVTKPSETVGGPVDVAIITKHEGLVWVKRKHFFNSELNSRFQLRQAAQHA